MESKAFLKSVFKFKVSLKKYKHEQIRAPVIHTTVYFAHPCFFLFFFFSLGKDIIKREEGSGETSLLRQEWQKREKRKEQVGGAIIKEKYGWLVRWMSKHGRGHFLGLVLGVHNSSQ